MGTDRNAKSEQSVRPVEMPAVRTTIVGGRPPGCGKTLGEIPRGIEVLVKKAVVDPAFRKVLLTRHAVAADEIGLALTPQEAMMLDQVPAAQLEAIIARTKVDPSRRGAFLGKAAGVMLAALGASSAFSESGCDSRSRVAEGVRPEPNSAAATVPSKPASWPTGEHVPQGARPDKPLAADVAARLAERADAASRPASQPTSRPTTLPISEGARPDVLPASGGAGARAEYPAMAGVMVGDRDQPLDVAGMTADRPPASRPSSAPASQPSSRPTTGPALSAAEIDSLIKQFDDDNFKVREAAQKKLRDQGIVVLPRLREVLLDKNLSAEARSRVEAVAFALAATTRPAKPEGPDYDGPILIAGIMPIR